MGLTLPLIEVEIDLSPARLPDLAPSLEVVSLEDKASLVPSLESSREEEASLSPDLSPSLSLVASREESSSESLDPSSLEEDVDASLEEAEESLESESEVRLGSIATASVPSVMV